MPYNTIVLCNAVKVCEKNKDYKVGIVTDTSAAAAEIFAYIKTLLSLNTISYLAHYSSDFKISFKNGSSINVIRYRKDYSRGTRFNQIITDIDYAKIANTFVQI